MKTAIPNKKGSTTVADFEGFKSVSCREEDLMRQIIFDYSVEKICMSGASPTRGVSMDSIQGRTELLYIEKNKWRRNRTPNLKKLILSETRLKIFSKDFDLRTDR